MKTMDPDVTASVFPRRNGWALFIRALNWQQSKYPSIDNWINNI
jgi:hypothetical protein